MLFNGSVTPKNCPFPGWDLDLPSDTTHGSLDPPESTLQCASRLVHSVFV